MTVLLLLLLLLLFVVVCWLWCYCGYLSWALLQVARAPGGLAVRLLANGANDIEVQIKALAAATRLLKEGERLVVQPVGTRGGMEEGGSQ